jgi:hypothetical protein
MDRLLADWRWLCTEEYELLDINDFGDLFLKTPDNSVLMLDLQSGTATRISSSAREFANACSVPENRKEWYFEDLALEFRRRGFVLAVGQVFGYKTPTCFAESSQRENNVYIADLYQYVSLMGSIQKQINDVPDGGKIRFVVQKSQ